MKKFLRSGLSVTLGLGLMLGTQVARAQALPVIPNAGFENWSPRTIQGLGGPLTYQAPVSWDMGFFSSLLAAFTGQAPKFDRSTTAHSGAASLRINVGADSIGADLITQFPVNRTTAGITLWARNSVVFADPDDSGYIITLFTRTRSSGQIDTVAISGGNLRTSVANTWQQLGFPVLPLQAITPDSATIYMGNPGGVLPNFQTYIDDIAFTNTVPMGTRDASATAAPLTLSPNPVSSRTTTAPTLTVPARASGRAALVLTDALGREAGRVRMHELHVGDNELPVPTAGLAAGTYLVRVLSSEGTRTTRLVIE